jgi:Dolichyl-phosphate-mannose-protein mannosyltransferase
LAVPDPQPIETPVAAPPRRRWLEAASPLLVSALTLLALVATDSQFGMVWDEGYTVRRDRLLDEWFGRVLDPASPGRLRDAFDKPNLDHYWPFSREEPDGHPPFYALLGVAGWRLGHRWLPPLRAYRFGPMLLTAATVGVIYRHLARRRGRLAGGLAAVFLVLMPRTFAHAHYAHYDMPMTDLWLLAQVAFVAGLGSRRWAVPFGVILGLCAGTKFTGLLAGIPAVAWVALVEILPRRAGRGARDAAATRAPRSGLRTLAIALPLAGLTLYAIQPPWWIEPLAGPSRFVASNLSRSKTQPLASLYLGKIYEFSLPWHNTIVLTAVTTPVLVLLLGLIGIGACLAVRRTEPWALIWPLSWATLMIVRALPNAPGHDGIRQFLPAVASLAVLAGFGGAWLAHRPPRIRGRAAIAVLLAAAVGECLIGIARTYPYTDSYYNLAIGGLKGAERAGFELTYYWETTGPEFLAWVREEASRRPVKLCFAMDSTNHELLREWGEIPAGVRILHLNKLHAGRPERPDYYIQQRRWGLYYPADLRLERHGRPVFAIRREGVDLLRVYAFEEFVEAFRITKDLPIPRYLHR